MIIHHSILSFLFFPSQEIYSTGPAETAEGDIVEQDSQEVIQYCSYKREEDESDVHEEKFILRFLATNTNNIHRYMWVTDSGEVRTDGGYTNIASEGKINYFVFYLLNLLNGLVQLTYLELSIINSRDIKMKI
jgi:hypothetical protein